MKDSIKVHCNSATIVIHKSEKSLMSCWITDVRSVLRLDHIRNQGACFGLVVLSCVRTSQISVRGASSSPPPQCHYWKVLTFLRF